MKSRHHVLRILPGIMLACILLPTPSQAQFSQEGPKLVGTDAIGNAQQGQAIALSADGNTAIVGGGNDDFKDGQPTTVVGAAWVFTRSGGIWTQQAKLFDPASKDASQGASVSISADGNTAIVGGPTDNNGLGTPFVGAAWIYTRSNKVWIPQAKLVGTSTGGASEREEQGVAVSLSADGNTAIVGAWGDDGFVGAAWIFVRSGTVWSQQGPKLVGTDTAVTAGQGSSVSLSGDGNTAIVGGPGGEAAWVFTRSGEVWSQQAKLVGTGALGGGAKQGYSVSLSGDGNTAIVGGKNDNFGFGAAWVYTRSRGLWNQQAKLVGTDALSNAQLGFSISLSSDGNTAIVGGPGPFDNRIGGAAWVFTRAGAMWGQQAKLVGAGAAGGALQGYSVSLSSDGSTAIVGGLNDNDGVGAAWVFARPVFAGTPGKPNCFGKSVSGLARQYGGLNTAAAALDFSGVRAIQNAILSFCGDSR